ncbi:Disks large-associated protein 5 [Chelonia mydas]|uniref:Disks large-associated protein 5 n=1 Tax=Chelonia mydas TaxID=8469 RepID=M7B7I0_CHEMY|nr:Disks large-associated protein 5 [Chelonia mydas]
MAATSQFANRYRKDLSTETLRTKVARRKSLIQKENRYKQFERSRQFGLADVNVQLSKDRGLPKLDETNEVRSQEKTTAKRKQTTNGAVNKSENERKEMLQRYKEEKELRKLKQQREKAKRGVFKVGLYRPNVPGFLPFVPQNPVIVKPKEKIYADHATNGHSVRPTQTGRRQTCADKVTEKKKECVSTKTQDAMQSSNKTSPVSADIPAIETKGGETDHDVPYFRNVLASETERLMSHCLQWDGKFDLDIPEDAKDLIRTTVGQTRLLIAERFKQFEGLVDNCEFKWGDKATTCTDLDGFWDMVSFQVEDVNKKFDNLSKLQENGWQPVNIPSKRAIKKKAVPSGISKLKQGAAGRTAARNRIAAIRAAMKEKMKQGETAADSAAQEMPKEEEKVVFEAGFFRIESPLKSFPGR